MKVKLQMGLMQVLFIGILLASSKISAQTTAMSIPTLGVAQQENFDGLGTAANAPLPAGFVVASGNGTSYSGGGTTTGAAIGTTVPGALTTSSAGNFFNFGDGGGTTATDRAIGFLSSGAYTSPRSIVLRITNNTGSTITALDIAFNYEKYRNGTRAFDMSFHHGSDGTAWSTAVAAGGQAYAADANNNVVNPVTSISKSVNLTGLSIANGQSYYLRWTYTGNGGSTNAKALGIDNFSITATANVIVVAPTVTTTQILQGDITVNSAVSGGNVTADGNGTVTRGVVWNTAANPIVALSTKTTDGSGTGTYTSNITGLTSNTRYYYRAYATNSAGTGYGTEYDFYTLAFTPAAPTVDDATTSTLDVTINANGNNAATQYAIQVVHNGSTYYVDASGTLVAGEVWQTAAQWGTRTLIGLQDDELYSVRIKARNGANVETALSPVTEGTTLSATAPMLTLISSNANFGSVCTNATGTGSFTFSGTNLTADADIVVFSLSGYTYSLTQNGTYSNTITIENYNGGNITVWVQFNPTAIQSYNGDISVAAPGGASLNVPVTGQGVNTAPTAVTGTSSAITSVSATLAGQASVQGCTTVTAFGIEYSTTNGFANGTGTQVTGTGSAASFTASLASLSPNTTYYYKAFATNSGGTSYGNQSSFITSAIGTPVTTDATVVITNGFTANWTAVAGATGYRLDVSTSPTFTQQSYASDLFISEYVEGSSSNKYLEIYNGTGETVNLSNYSIRLYSNGNSFYNEEEVLSGTLAHGSTLVLKNAAASIYSGTATSSAAINFTGDDAVALYKISTGSFVDIFGRIGEDPGSSWSMSGTHSTGERTLRRKASVMGGVTTNPGSGFPTLASEWDQFGQDTVSGLGSHSFNGSPVGFFVTGYENLAVGNVTSFEVTGLEEMTTYYYRVRAVSTNSTSANSNATEVTTKVGAVTWNGTAWIPSAYPNGDPVVKDNTINAVIAGNFNTGTDETFTPKDLIINSGIFTVATGTTFTVQNQIINNASAANFIVENDATLLQVNDVDNTGNATVYRYTNELFRLDYTIWSAPVTGQNLFSFSPGTQITRFYTYGNNAENTGTEFLSVSADDNYADNGGTPNFVPGRGYLIRMPNTLTDQMSGYPASTADYNAGTFASIFEGQFAGVPNNGDVTLPYMAAGKFNIVGNPYPSPINVQDFFADNAANLDPGYGLYFWRKKNNADATSYAVLTADSYIANDGGVESPDGEYTYGGQQWESYYNGTLDENWTIAPGQGFFVRAAAGATGISFNNQMRQAPQPGQPFFRNGSDVPAQKSKLWFNLTAPGMGFSQASVVYNPSSTLGIDAGKDARHFGTSGLTALFTFAADETLAIQSRPEFNVNDVVPLGYRVNTAGTYTIKLHRMEGVFEGDQQVYLRDNVLNVIHNIKEGDYTFTTEQGTFNSRFDIIYTTEALGTDDNVIDADAVVVYRQDNLLRITTGNELMQGVTVYDLRGRELYRAQAVNSQEHTINGLPIQQQVLLVQVSTPKGTVTKKVMY